MGAGEGQPLLGCHQPLIDAGASGRRQQVPGSAHARAGPARHRPRTHGAAPSAGRDQDAARPPGAHAAGDSGGRRRAADSGSEEFVVRGLRFRRAESGGCEGEGTGLGLDGARSGRQRQRRGQARGLLHSALHRLQRPHALRLADRTGRPHGEGLRGAQLPDHVPAGLRYGGLLLGADCPAEYHAHLPDWRGQHHAAGLWHRGLHQRRLPGGYRLPLADGLLALVHHPGDRAARHPCAWLGGLLLRQAQQRHHRPCAEGHQWLVQSRAGLRLRGAARPGQVN